MKKGFVEPQMKRIELNLKENIASSIQEGMGYYFNTTLFSCTIQDTKKYIGQVTEAEAETCRINANARIGGGVIVPWEEARMHFRY